MNRSRPTLGDYLFIFLIVVTAPLWGVVGAVMFLFQIGADERKR